MSAYYNETGNCTNGGDHASVPYAGYQMTPTFIAIEGNDTSFAPFRDCCLKPVGFFPPCTLWCEEDSTGPPMQKCWDKHGFHPYSYWGVTVGPKPQRAFMPVIIGVVLGSVAFLALVTGLWLWWLGTRSIRLKDSDSTWRWRESIKLGSTVPPSSQEALKYDLRPNILEEDTKYNIIVKQPYAPSTCSSTRPDNGDTHGTTVYPEEMLARWRASEG